MPDSSPRCLVLKEDPELAEPIPPERREQAIRDCTGPELWIQPGPLGPSGTLGFRGGLGVLVLSGLMVRRVGIEGRFETGDGLLLEIGLALAVQLHVIVLRFAVIQPIYWNDVHTSAVFHHDSLEMLLRRPRCRG